MHSQRVENSLKRISMQFSFSLVFPDRVTILLTSSITNVWRTVRRICIFISGFKGLNVSQSAEPILISVLCPYVMIWEREVAGKRVPLARIDALTNLSYFLLFSYHWYFLISRIFLFLLYFRISFA